MQPDGSVTHEIMRVQEMFWQALQAKDTSLLMAIVAPDFVGRSPGESDQTRDDFIATLTGFPGSISAVAGEGVAVHTFGDVGVLTGTQLARIRLPDGREMHSQLILNNVFRRDSEGWRLVLSHSQELVREA